MRIVAYQVAVMTLWALALLFSVVLCCFGKKSGLEARRLLCPLVCLHLGGGDLELPRVLTGFVWSALSDKK